MNLPCCSYKADQKGEEVRADNQDIATIYKERAKVVISDVEEDEEDPSKQGKSLSARKRQSVENVQTYTRRSRLVSTADVSTASELGSTAGVKAKDKEKPHIKSLSLKEKSKREFKFK
ncbi:hypothetical protein Tco_0764361 [Tanacetum coccineum]